MHKAGSLNNQRRVFLAGAALVAPILLCSEAAAQTAAPSAAGCESEGEASGTGGCRSTAAEEASLDAAGVDGDIVVTGTRWETRVQDAPVNITAIGARQIEARRLDNLREIVREVPGVYIADNGPRSGSPIVFRGLNADPLRAADGNNDGGGTVATYVGEVPLYIDLRLNDIERVEFLAGPQGTLYGAGTLAGAIRYIPRRPQFDRTTVEARGEVYDYAGGSPSFAAGATLNLPLAPTLAFRASLDRLDDGGFVDQPYVVDNPGFSNPDPVFTDPADVAANTHRERDVNTDEVWSGRAALRWQPIGSIDVNLAYHFQQEETRGRQISSRVVTNFPVPVGRYDNLRRVLEPSRRINHLASLEVSADLDFATLTSATGRSWFKDDGNRDQTDLLITLEYSYEAFPTFTATTQEHDREEAFTQEFRLVSKDTGPLSWIVGAFYNVRERDTYTAEFTPGYSEYLVNSVGFPGPVRPDSLEYVSVLDSRLKEMAGYAELSYRITPRWQMSIGGRYYDYSYKTRQAVDTPLFDTVSGNRGPDEIFLEYQTGGSRDSGFLYKVNGSYRLAKDALLYATVSQGYRIGNSNAVAACPDPLPPNQNVCALPGEAAYRPDKTQNYEIGIKTQWFDRRLTANASLYHISWKDPQIASATENGAQPITVNGKGARSRGFELLVAAEPVPGLSMRAAYAYTDPQLTALAPNLIRFTTGPGFESTAQYADGLPGDRLPASPHHTGSASIAYSLPLSQGRTLTLSYGIYGQSNVLSTTGGRGGSYTLPGFTRSDAALRLQGTGGWSLTLYCENLFDSYAESAVSGAPADNQHVFDETGRRHYVRNFFTYVQPPRQIGLRFAMQFD